MKILIKIEDDILIKDAGFSCHSRDVLKDFRCLLKFIFVTQILTLSQDEFSSFHV